MKALHELKDKLCDELNKIAKKRDMSAGDLEMAHKLTDTIKNIDKILMLEGDEGGYSEIGNWNANIRGGYSDNSSYARRRDSRGRYAHNDGYSRAGDLLDMMEEKMRHAKSDRERDAIRRCMDIMSEV